MVQFVIVLAGFLLLSHMMSTPEQRHAARLRVKKIEPYCIAIIVIVVGFLTFAWIKG